MKSASYILPYAAASTMDFPVFIVSVITPSEECSEESGEDMSDNGASHIILKCQRLNQCSNDFSDISLSADFRHVWLKFMLIKPLWYEPRCKAQ